MIDKGSSEDIGGCSHKRIFGTTWIADMEIREGGNGNGGDAGQQQKRCGTKELAFLGN